ncbi:hypothetical protein OESDEN_02589 [Oesophagostomum dentatum]|uniref:Glucuronosyltransferase n=1 Tax=Oesophagostomum dentatum TaxID=61180 RepID=A0A0B1TPV7_OESDE|nr:hypothetical protein OESDEN_02589 [Oesophagostomum dentatum]
MLHDQPISPERLLLKHGEFAAKFGHLPNLDSYGRHLSVIQYYLIDIAVTIVLGLASILTLIAVIIKKYCCIRSPKTKSE